MHAYTTSHNFDHQSLSEPCWSRGASINSCLIYINNTISYQNRNVKTHLWQLSQFPAIISDIRVLHWRLLST